MESITVTEMYSIVALAIALIFVGTVLILIDVLRGSIAGGQGGGRGRVEAGGAVIVGPIPIVFGSSSSMARAMLVLAIVLTTLAIILTLINHVVVR